MGICGQKQKEDVETSSEKEKHSETKINVQIVPSETTTSKRSASRNESVLQEEETDEIEKRKPSNVQKTDMQITKEKENVERNSQQGESILRPMENIVDEPVKSEKQQPSTANDVGGESIEDSSMVSNAEPLEDVTITVNAAAQSESVDRVYSEDVQAGDPKEKIEISQWGKQDSLDISDVPTIPEFKYNLLSELSVLQKTFLESRKMKFGHANSLLKEKEQTLMESTAEIHMMIQLYESTSDATKHLELEIIMERKFDALIKEFSSYQDILNNDDESSMLLDMGNTDLLSPLMDFSETSEVVPPDDSEDQIMKLAAYPLVPLE